MQHRDKLKSEKGRLSKIAKTFSMGTGFNGRLEKYRIRSIQENIKGPNILDVGCADGFMARALAPYFKHITAIDGSEKLIARAKALRLKNVDFIWTLFEEYKPPHKFDSVILSDILEHINDPIALLKAASGWVKDSGRIVILCPNANSVHRHIGVHAGMLKSIYSLNATDHKVGHRRVYDIQLLTHDLKKAGLKVTKFGGMFFKPLSNDQMNKLDNKVIEAFYEVGRQLPSEMLTEIYVQCRKA
jgi:2-polyprenyl-3-methyl-5-hydroxy-6-metoxy-1,4-benzoquinol methylase